MNKIVEEQLSQLKTHYAKDGFVIVGVGGSYARGEECEDSDIDLVYKIENPAIFTACYGGFGAFSKINEIKDEIGAALGKNVDLIALNGLNEIGRKYIIEDMRYVN